MGSDGFCEEVPLTVASLKCLAEHLDDPTLPNNSVQVSEIALEPHPLDALPVQAIRDKIIADYTGTVLRFEILPNPKVRGGDEIGYARIDLKPGAMPKKQRHMNLGGPRLEAMTKIADFWIEKELAKEDVSPWSSPAFPVAKKGNRWRGLVDFRWLNENTLSDGYPLPRIEDSLATMGRKMIFTVLDLKDAFH